jgi:hypothetical protein
MRIRDVVCAGVLPALLFSAGAPASAQTFESAGVRAQGLGGAFVAVADDATASWWNPAGLATGAYLSAVVERGRTTEPAEPAPDGPGLRTTTGDFAIAFPALGLSYYRFRVSALGVPGSTAADGADRQDPAAGSSVRSVAVSQFGATVGQSIGQHVVFGSTIKVVRAGAISGTVQGTDPLDDADDLAVERDTHVDLDLGAMANFGRVRVGLSVKNVTEPAFGDEGADPVTLARQARVGVAVLSVPNGAFQGITAAADADLTTTATPFGDVRHAAAGVEGWLANGRVGLRGGVSANTVGDTRPAASAGVSVGITRGFHVNASKTLGRDKSMTGWSSSVSVTF